MYNLSNKSSRITPPEGYTEIPIEWGDGEKLYVYINPNETSQTVYIGSDKNYKSTERSKVITFETNNESGATSIANLNVIQAATTVNTLQYFWEYNLKGEITSQEIGSSNTINLPMSTSSEDILTLKMYAQATINEGEEIRTYLPLTIISQSPTSSKIHVSLEDTETLKITVDNPQDQTSDTLNLTVNGGENGNYYWEELGITVGWEGANLVLVQAENTSTSVFQNFKAYRNNTLINSGNTYEVPRDGLTITYKLQIDEVVTYESGEVKTITYDSEKNPEIFQMNVTQDLETPEGRIQVQGFSVLISAKSEITWEATNLASVSLLCTKVSKPRPITETLTHQRNRFTINSYLDSFALHSLEFATKFEDKVLPDITLEGSVGTHGSMEMIASGGTYTINQAIMPFKVTTEAGANPTILFLVGKGINVGIGKGTGWVSESDPDALIPGIPLTYRITDMQGEDSVTVDGGSVTDITITAPSLGNTLYSDGKYLGSINLYIWDSENSQDFYHIAILDILYEPNVFKATKVDSFDYTYPNIPAKGGTIYFDEFILSMDGTWTSGATQTGLVFSDIKNAKNSYLLPNYGIKMHLYEFVDESNITPDVIPSSIISSMIDYLIPPSSAVDDDTMAITYPKRSVGMKRIISSQEYKVATLSIYIQDSLGNNLYIDGTTNISLAPNRIRVINIIDRHFLDSWNIKNYYMPAIGMDITEQVMMYMSCSLQVTFDSEENLDISVMGLNVNGNVVDGTNAFINLDCTEDPDVHYGYAKIPPEYWIITPGTSISTPSTILPLPQHRSPLDDYVISNSIAEGFKGKNLNTLNKYDNTTFNANYYPDGLFLAPGIRALALSIPTESSGKLIVSHNDSSITTTDDLGIQDSWDKYINIPWQANKGLGISITNKNTLIPTYYNSITKDWILGLTTKDVTLPNSNYFPYDYYFEVVNNSYIELHIIMPKIGGTIYLRDFGNVTTFRESGFINSSSSVSNEEIGNSFSFVNPDSVPELTIVGYPDLSESGSLPGPSLFGIKVEANTKGIYRRLGVLSQGYNINIYNNNNSDIGRGSVVTIKIEQKG